MDSFDLNTRLPPRKRLLVGLKEGSSNCGFPPPLPPVSRTASSHEEVVEASRSAALSAAEVAAAARAAATEKAVAAVKARAAAKSALELLDSVVRNEVWRQGCLARSKPRKKHVPVKLLYKKNRLVEAREADQELARRLHRAMNSSPRISSSSGKNPSVVCNDGDLINRRHVDKLEEVLVCSRADLLEREEGCGYIEEHHHGSKGMLVARKKI